MGDTSGIFHILYIYYRTYVGVCVTPFFFFFGVRCAQYKVHAQCSFAALAPLMPCMLLVFIILFVLSFCCVDVHYYQLRAYLYQARDMYSGDRGGLSGTYT